tara:strand:+ start:7349 stop:9418 length:2070 start_codon:yes stop_codon:yes gene_type:complete
MFQKIEKYGTINPIAAGNSASSERIKSLANLGKAVQSIAFDVGRKKRVKEGQIEGAKAGTEAAESGVAPEEKGSFKFFDESFNDAQQGAYLASMDNQAITKLGELESQFEYDVEGYRKTSKGMLDGLVKNVPEAYRQPLIESINNYITRGSMRVNNNVVKRGEEETKSELTNAADTYSREASRAARNGDFDQMDDLIGKLELSSKAMVSGGFWTKEQGDSVVMDSRKEIFRQGNKRDILETAKTNPEKAVKMLSKFESKVPENYTPDEHERNVDDIRADLSRLMPTKKGGGTAKEGKDWLKKAKDSLEFGFPISSTEKARGAALLAGTDKQDEYSRLMKVEQFALLPAKQQNNILAQLNNAKTLESQADFMAFSKIRHNLAAKAKEDGMTLAERQGVIDPANIDGGNIEERNAQAEELSERFGVTVSPFKLTEVEALIESMDDMTPKDKADLAMGLGGNEATYKQLDKKNASMFAMLSARNDEEIAKAVFLGEELIKTKQVKLPSQDDYMADLDEYLGAVGEVYQVEDRATIIRAAKSYYATLGNEEYDPGSMEKALLAITGGVGSVNGRKVELPQGVDEDDLDDFFNEINLNTLEQFGGLLHPHDIDDIRDGNLVSVGSNRYQIEVNGARQYNKKHEPFEIVITPELLMMNDQANQTPMDKKTSRNVDRVLAEQERQRKILERKRSGK